MSSIITSKKSGQKSSIFQLDFRPDLASKSRHLLVRLAYLSLLPQRVIRITVSTCLEYAIMMSFEADGSLVEMSSLQNYLNLPVI